MTNDALINNKVIIMSNDEKYAAQLFHLARIKFAWVNGVLKFGDEPGDDRDHQHWLNEDFGISVEEFEKIPRGYMLINRIQLFIGSDFRPIDISAITLSDIMALRERHIKKYGKNYFIGIYNGVKVGKIGEIWEPLEMVLTIQ